jgi:hypothetical protein
MYPAYRAPRIRLDRATKFFWDTFIPCLVQPPINFEPVRSGVYFTDFSGDAPGLHAAKVALRGHGFDPQVVHEVKTLAKRRQETLDRLGVIEKPKGVDIGLTVRLLEDGYRHIYDVCYLLTSDADYIPVIKAIRQLGRQVVVFGFKDGQGAQSELEYVPDQFVDLGQYMEREYE